MGQLSGWTIRGPCSPTFNHIQAAQDPRLVQFALNFLY
jgi:hypothetical protein